MEEVWKKIPNYNYEVSNLGRVRNYTTKQIKAQSVNNCGYHQVSFTYRRDKNGNIIIRNGKKVQYRPIVSRLVCENFIPIPQEFLDKGYTMDDLECNHRSEDKNDNTVSNLEWVTPKQNMNYGTRNQRHSNYAKNMPESHRAKLSEAAKRRGAHANNGIKVFVKLIDENGNEQILDSVREAARFLEANPSKVHYSAKHNLKINGYTIIKIL